MFWHILVLQVSCNFPVVGKTEYFHWQLSRRCFYSLAQVQRNSDHGLLKHSYSSIIPLWQIYSLMDINSLRPRQNGHHFADDTLKHIFLNQNVRNSIDISLKFVPNGRIHNITSLVQIMAWHWPGDKPLSEPMMVRLPTHICITRPQWVNKTICQPSACDNCNVSASELKPSFWTKEHVFLAAITRTIFLVCYL